jgi:taurine dioxygenase
MIKYHLHTNGWTVLLDSDLHDATLADIKHVARLLNKYTLVVGKKQNLSVAEHLRLTKMFKDPVFLDPELHTGSQSIVVPDTEGLLLRVGGEVDKYGIPGIAESVAEVIWHSDPHWPDLKCMIIFLAAIHGTSNSKTSWCNNLLAYSELDQTTKDLLEPLKSILLTGIDFNKDLSFIDEYGLLRPPSSGFNQTGIRNIQTNKNGEKGLYFPFNQMHRFEGMSEKDSKSLIQKIASHITQEKYCYHHKWDDGDVVFTDQRFGLHMRHRCEHISTRSLRRSVSDYPDQDYELPY